MGRYDSYDDDDDLEQDSNENSSSIKALRGANRAKEQRIKELEEQLTKALAGQRERSIKDVVSAKGLNPKVAALVPKELTDEESVTKWLDEYADIFGGAGSDASTVSDDEAATLQSMDRTMSSGQPPAGPQAMIERIKTMPFEELERLISGAGQ